MRKIRLILSCQFLSFLVYGQNIPTHRSATQTLLRDLEQLVHPAFCLPADQTTRAALPVLRQLAYTYYRYDNNRWVSNAHLTRTLAPTAHPVTEVLINAANPSDTLQSYRYSFDTQQRPVALVYKSTLGESYNDTYAYNADGTLAKNISVQVNNIHTLDTTGISDARYRFDARGRMNIRTARYLYQYNYAFPDTVRNETREDWKDSIAYRSGGTYPLELFHFVRPTRRGGAYRLQKQVKLDMADSVNLVPRTLHTKEYDLAGGDSLETDLVYHSNGPNAWNGEERTMRYGVLSSTRRSHLKIDPRMFVHRDRLPISFAQTPVAALAFPEADSWILIDDRSFQPNGTMLQYSISDSVGVRSDGIPTVRVRRLAESFTDTTAAFLPEVKIVLDDIQTSLPERRAQALIVVAGGGGEMTVHGLPKGSWMACFTDATGKALTLAQPVIADTFNHPMLPTGLYIAEFWNAAGERIRSRVLLP